MKASNLKVIELNEIKKLQMEIADEIDRFCSENGIKYYILGGTLLGAIRHKGYIPWDDDIDIGLLKDDYDMLLSSFNSFSGNVEIINHSNVKGYDLVYSKAIHKKTLLIEGGVKKAQLGVNIDIFPIDKMPTSKLKMNFMLYVSSALKDMLALKHIRMNKNKSLLKNIVIMFGRLLYIIPDKLLIKLHSGLRELFSVQNNDYTFLCNCCGAWGKREVVPRECLEETIRVEFEGKMYSAPVDYDMYLKCIYGDYMTLPPVEKRISHHNYVAYWK